MKNRQKTDAKTSMNYSLLNEESVLILTQKTVCLFRESEMEREWWTQRGGGERERDRERERVGSCDVIFLNQSRVTESLFRFLIGV